MQFQSPSTPAQFSETARLTRPKNYWLRLLGLNWYASLLVIIAFGVLVAPLVTHEPVKWNAFGILLALAAFRFGISYTRLQDRTKKALAAAHPGPGTWTLEPAGIRSTLANGATGFVPWTSYDKWVEGKSVFVVTGPSIPPVVLPVDDSTRDMLRGTLQSNIRNMV